MKHITIQKAAQIVCDYCGGRFDYSQSRGCDGADAQPIRVNEDDYIPNFGEVKRGEWIHHCKHGEHHRCEAGNLWEYALKEATENPPMPLRNICDVCGAEANHFVWKHPYVKGERHFEEFCETHMRSRTELRE